MTYWNHPGWEERKTQVVCYLALLLQGQVVFRLPGEYETGGRVRRSWGRTGGREKVGAWLRMDVSWRLIEVSKPSTPPQVAAFTFQPFVPSNLWQPDQAQSTSVPATKTSVKIREVWGDGEWVRQHVTLGTNGHMVSVEIVNTLQVNRNKRAKYVCKCKKATAVGKQLCANQK